VVDTVVVFVVGERERERERGARAKFMVNITFHTPTHNNYNLHDVNNPSLCHAI
jgi:hypothetical protein